MGMSNYILDNVDKFWAIADEAVSESESVGEFVAKMSWYRGLLNGSSEYCETPTEFEELLEQAWHEKWSSYAN